MVFFQEYHFGLVSKTAQFFLSDIDREIPGEIIDSDKQRLPSRTGGAESYYIRFIYFIDDEAYIGDVVSYEINSELVNERLQSYQAGQTVLVKYDSSFPRWSLLEEGSMSTRMLYHILLSFIIWPALMYGTGKFMFHD